MARFSKNMNKQSKNRQNRTITFEFKKWLKKFNNKYSYALKELAKK